VEGFLRYNLAGEFDFSLLQDPEEAAERLAAAAINRG
jgi:hypothetical protein